MRRTQTFRIALLVVLLLASGVRADAVALAPIALTGMPAAGAPEGATWQSVSTPRINNRGQVVFTGSLTPGTGGVTSDDNSAIWGPGESGHLTMFGREGSQAPGTPPGALFAAGLSPYLNDEGRVAFKAELQQAQGVVWSTNDTGIWSTSSPGELVLRVRAGDPSPAGEPFGTVRALSALGASGELIFPSWLSQQTAIWSLSASDHPVLLLRGGEQVEGAPPGANFATNHGDPIRLNSSGQIVLRASLETWSGGVDGESNRIILRGTAESGLTMVAREGDPVPDAIPGAVFADAFSNPMLNEAGDMALLGGLRVGTGGVTDDDDDVIWLIDREGQASVIAREGDPAPGAPDGAIYSQLGLGHVSLNDAGQVAFNGRLAVGPGGVVAGEEQAIWGPGPDGELTMLVRDGDPVPGRPPEVRFKGVSYGPVLNNRGDIVFEASWEEDVGGEAAYRAGLFAIDAQGEAHPLLRWGQIVELAPGDERIVDEFWFGASTATGWRDVNDLGQLVVTVRFTDYSVGILLISIDERECSDGVDNDGDGLVDFGDDPGCLLPIGLTESPVCDDGEDNDGDGLVDYGEDPGCGAPWWGSEQRGCGLGWELALALAALAVLRRPSTSAVRKMRQPRRPGA